MWTACSFFLNNRLLPNHPIHKSRRRYLTVLYLLFALPSFFLELPESCFRPLDLFLRSKIFFQLLNAVAPEHILPLMRNSFGNTRNTLRKT